MNRTPILVPLLFLAAPLLWSTTRPVPQQYPTIQAAINASQTGDTVLVSEGRYLENIRFQGKGIVVTSRFFLTRDWQTVFQTVIDGSACVNKDTASTVQFLYGEDSSAVVQGFTITGGTGTKVLGSSTVQEGGGIYLRNSTAQILCNFIAWNALAPTAGVNNGGGGGISSYYGNPTIRNNIVFSNASGYAGGIVLNWSRGRIRNNLVYHNAALQRYGCGGVMVWQAPNNGGIVENNTIVGNTSAANAGGISISVTDATTIPTVRNNIVWGNRQVTGGQVTSPQYATFNCVEDLASGSNVAFHPQFQDSTFALSSGSPCIDAGDPDAVCQDISDPGAPGFPLAPSRGGSRNDLGVTGGPWAVHFPALHLNHVHLATPAAFQGPVAQQVTAGFEVMNLGTGRFMVDSVTHSNTAAFSLSGGTAGRMLEVMRSDSVALTFQGPYRGTFTDTLRVYHRLADTANPLIFPVSATANSGPVLHRALPAQNAPAGRLFTLQIPDSMFLDVDPGDTLTYQCAGLPGWLSFHQQTRTLSGTPPAVDGIPWIISITVRDILQASASSAFLLVVQPATGVGGADGIPAESYLRQNYPNPFNPTTVIRFGLQTQGEVELTVFNILGKRVATLLQGPRPAGAQEIEWNAVGMPTGVYFLELVTPEFRARRKMILLR
jgi:hypothetical protein